MKIRVKIGPKFLVLNGAQSLPLAGNARIWSREDPAKLADAIAQGMRERFNIGQEYTKKQRAIIFNNRSMFSTKRKREEV